MLIWENEAVDLVFGQEGEDVWVLHVKKGGKPKLTISHIPLYPGEEDALQDLSDNRARSMAATLLEQLVKVEA